MKTLFFSTLLFFSLLCVTFLLFLPYLTDIYLLPRVTNTLPFSKKEISLSRISPWKLRGTVVIADNDQDILSLPLIEFNYSPRSILNRKIHSILIEGGTLNLNLNNVSQEENDRKLSLFLPVACDKIFFKNSSIIVRQGQKEHQVVVSGRLDTHFKELEDGRKQLISAATKFRLTGALALSADATLHPKDTGHELLFTASAPDISNLTSLFPELNTITLKGQLALSGSVQIEDLKQISELQATAHLSKFRSVLENIVLTDISSTQPLTIAVKKNKEKIYTEIKSLFIASPQQGSVEIQGEYNLENRAFTGAGHVTIQAIPLPVKFSFSGHHSALETLTKFSGSTNSFSLGEASPLLFSPFYSDGEIRIRQGDISGRVNASVDRITLPSEKTEFQDISLTLPLQFPLKNNAAFVGTFRVGSINYDATPSGSISGEMGLNSMGATFTAHIESGFGPDLRVQCSGTLTMDKQSEFSCRLPRTHIDSVSFPPFLVLPPELSIEGDLSVEAGFSSSDMASGGNLHLQFNDGTVNISESKLSAINVAMNFPNLPLLQSEPSQLCTIGSIEFGNIKLSRAKVHFRVESPQSIFIERSGFSWCDGKVESGGYRLKTTEKKLETTLYCDRLNFTQLLSQFGIEDTEGEGSLNGKLPIVLSENNITFDDGFLFSTPGDSGIIRFNNSSQLRQGIGAIDQTPYLDYSMQALENFSYNWTKLTFNSQEEDLLIKMQLDGKPAVPLPFGYRKGHIVPSEKGPGLQHPIRLDVNFRLPITHLFQYGKNMQSIMENM
jgi:hypothetical protein